MTGEQLEHLNDLVNARDTESWIAYAKQIHSPLCVYCLEGQAHVPNYPAYPEAHVPQTPKQPWRGRMCRKCGRELSFRVGPLDCGLFCACCGKLYAYRLPDQVGSITRIIRRPGLWIRGEIVGDGSYRAVGAVLRGRTIPTRLGGTCIEYVIARREYGPHLERVGVVYSRDDALAALVLMGV